MWQTLRDFGDRLLGRGSAAITVPTMDGALKPNRALDEAAVVAELPGIADLATDGRALFVAAGPVLYRLDGERLVEQRRFDAEISALAVAADGTLAVALGGRLVRVFGADGSAELARLDAAAGRPLQSANALAFGADGVLWLSDGSAVHGPLQWCHDLMSLGRSGRIVRWRFRDGAAEVPAGDCRYAFGVLPRGDGVLYSESWRHRVVSHGPAGARALLAELPGYPSRLAPAADGGLWITCFVCRTQLVEFVLREPAYRRRMMAEIDPRYWIAPALSSGGSFLEPLQGAGVKQMGVLKPWAPPRSYGLVIRADAEGRIVSSLHSLVDGRHHGITAVQELGGRLYAASQGGGRLLAVDLARGEAA